MDIFEILQKRYSCRNYINKEVKDEDVFKIINYASLAPSAGNLQPWHVIVIKNRDKRELVSVASLNQTWMSQAPIHLIICGNEEYVKRFYKLKGELYCKQDCAAFTENILLIATSLGLSSCWVGAFDENMIKREFEIPEEIRVYAIVILGYSNEKNPGCKQRYDSNSFTFFDKYGNRVQDLSLLIPLAESIPRIKEKHKNIFFKLKEKLGLPKYPK